MIYQEKIQLKSSSKNQAKLAICTEQRLERVSPKVSPTLQGKVSSKNKVTLTRTQYYWTSYLFKNYELKKPGWLRTQFKLNQRRLKQLNKLLWEAAVDKDYCGCCKDISDWSYHLHAVWHLINRVEQCV